MRSVTQGSRAQCVAEIGGTALFYRDLYLKMVQARSLAVAGVWALLAALLLPGVRTFVTRPLTLAPACPATSLGTDASAGASRCMSWQRRARLSRRSAAAAAEPTEPPGLNPRLNPNSPYASYNYSNYWQDVADADPKDSEEYRTPLEAYPAGAADDEVLEVLRALRQAQNDVWQSTLFRDTHGGDFAGSYELFVPRLRAGQWGVARCGAGSCSSAVTAGPLDKDVGVRIDVMETYSPHPNLSPSSNPIADPTPDPCAVASGLLLRATRESLEPWDFRTSCGNQAVGAAYTLSRLQVR